MGKSWQTCRENEADASSGLTQKTQITIQKMKWNSAARSVGLFFFSAPLRLRAFALPLFFLACGLLLSGCKQEAPGTRLIGTSLDIRFKAVDGRDVNLASRVVARARGGEVLVSDAVFDALRDSPHLEFEQVGRVKLKGFAEPRTLCRAVRREE